MKTKFSCSFMVLALLPLAILDAKFSNLCAQGTAFTYQGQLNSGGSPANGSYDLSFTLYFTNAAGKAIAGPVTNSGTPVVNGLFTSTIDFGDVYTGTNYWLEISVSTNEANLFTILAPRQAITPTPYAVFASTASNVNGTISASQISGTVASANLSGTYSNAVMLNNAGNSFYGNGANLTSLNAADLSSGTVPTGVLPSGVPTSLVFAGLNGVTGAIANASGAYTITLGQTNLWPATNLMAGGGSVNCFLPATTLNTNTSFTFALPSNIQSPNENLPLITVHNTSSSLITMGFPADVFVTPVGVAQNVTNNAKVLWDILPGSLTNATIIQIN
jgi:hypothetical protein